MYRINNFKEKGTFLNLNNILLDLDFVRSQFPSFEDPMCKEWSFFENAGGSYVPKTVINKLSKFMISTKVQPYAEYSMSKIAGQQMDEATKIFAKMINAEKKEIIIGDSTSSNLYVLSNALKKNIKKGDEIIVTNQDHEANISPWSRLKENGAVIKEWKFNKKNGELEIKDLKKLISKKTKIVAVTHCSNIIGSINDLKKISEIVHKHGGILIGDGVSFAPHGFPNVKKLNVDFYTFSLYKTYGPHIALMYGKKELLKKLPNQNHEFLKGEYPYTLNPGGPNHEELVSILGIYEYFNSLYNHHFSNKKKSLIEKISNINELFAKHEQMITNPLLDYLDKNPNFTLYGKNKIENKNRAPTIAFTHKRKSSKIVSNFLIKHKIATRNDNFYAWRCLKHLGVDTEDGVVRISLTHYNTNNEVDNLIKILDKI